MKKTLLLILLISLFNFQSFAGFGIVSSAVYLTVNGTYGFYNTQTSSSTPLGTQSFGTNLGVFGNNSSNLKIMGGAINTSKSNGGNVCVATLYYIVYENGSRPSAPVFASINLDLYSSVSNNQQWITTTNQIDLTTFPVGDYTLEIYYAASGNDASGNCTQTKLDNAAGADYKANFSITNPLALSFSSLYGIVNSKTIDIKWSTQSDLDIISYEVQKSDNGLDFTTIGTINSKRSMSPNNYYFRDMSPFIGGNYYRIKADNNNSTISLTNIVRLYFATVGNSVLIYPNPTGNILTVRLAGINKGNYQLSVLSSSGQTIVTMPEIHDGTDKNLYINLPKALPKGIYWLFFIDRTQFFKQEFMVK